MAHPDSGFVSHHELGSNFLAPGIDFVENDDNAANDHGAHGLGTASVIISQDNRASQPRSVTGIAPEAVLLPMRVATNNPIHPAVLFCMGVKRLRSAILRAIEEDCHVISMSLGWLANEALHAAIQQAYEKDIIMLAAAGNYVGMVVWPAAYPETIALAGCTAKRNPWTWSSRGKRVDVAGPAKKVWVASAEGAPIRQSDGTSQATATSAGIAALWLAHHGRDNLLAKYRGKRQLADVFRHCIQASSDPPPRNNGRWGSGIVNARQCLQLPLPDAHQTLFESFGVADAGADTEVTPGALAALDDTTEAQLTDRLAAAMGVTTAQLQGLSASATRELHTLALTDPELRSRVFGDSDQGEQQLEGFGVGSTSDAGAAAAAVGAALPVGVSPQLATALKAAH